MFRKEDPFTPQDRESVKHEGRYESDASNFFSETISTITIKFMYHGHILGKLRLFFHKVSSVINTSFTLLRETLYAGRVKLFAEGRSSTRTLFQFVVASKTASSDCILQGPKKMQVGGC
jgi:hypothetical protein